MNPNLTPEEQQKILDAQLAERDKIFKTTVETEAKKLEESHDKKEYTFSTVERRRLLQHETIIISIQQFIDDIINQNVLPRIGISPNPTIKVFYDIPLGKLIVWTPKPIPVAEVKEEVKPEPKEEVKPSVS